MSQPAVSVSAGSVSAALPNVTPAAPTSVSTPFLGDAVIPLVNKLQDIFSQLGSASTIDLPQVSKLVA